MIPLPVGELGLGVLCLDELDFGRRRRAGRNIDLLRSCKVAARCPDRDVVMAGPHPVGRETEFALCVAHYGSGYGRALFLGADQDAFHQAFFGRRHLAAQRRNSLRIRAHGGEAGQQTHQAHGRQKPFGYHFSLPERIVRIGRANLNLPKLKPSMSPVPAHPSPTHQCRPALA